MKRSRILILLVFTVILQLSCSHNPNKAEKIETKLEGSENVSSGESIGMNEKGEMLWQKKVSMSEELRKLQFNVYESEDRIYGNRKYQSKGLYGELKDCLKQLATGPDSKQMMMNEPLERLTDKEELFNVGVDEKDKLVGVSEEFLKDRLDRFREYKRILNKKEDEFDDRLGICQSELKTRNRNKNSVPSES